MSPMKDRRLEGWGQGGFAGAVRATEIAPLPRHGDPVGWLAETSFVRHVDLSFPAVVSALETWWEADQSEGFVNLAATVLVGRLSIEHGIGRVGVVVRRPRRPSTRSFVMELELAPWSERRPVTRLELVPRRRVRLSRRYFQTGHWVVDTLITELRCSSALAPGLSHLVDAVRPDGDDDTNLIATSVPRVGAS